MSKGDARHTGVSKPGHPAAAPLITAAPQEVGWGHARRSRLPREISCHLKTDPETLKRFPSYPNTAPQEQSRIHQRGFPKERSRHLHTVTPTRHVQPHPALGPCLCSHTVYGNPILLKAISNYLNHFLSTSSLSIDTCRTFQGSPPRGLPHAHIYTIYSHNDHIS